MSTTTELKKSFPAQDPMASPATSPDARLETPNAEPIKPTVDRPTTDEGHRAFLENMDTIDAGQRRSIVNVARETIQYHGETSPVIMAQAVAHIVDNADHLDDLDFERLEATVGEQSALRSPEHRGEQIFHEHAVKAVVDADVAFKGKEDGCRMINAAVAFYLSSQECGGMRQQPLATGPNRMKMRTKALAFDLADRFDTAYDRRKEQFSLTIRRKGAAINRFASEEAETVVAEFARWAVS